MEKIPLPILKSVAAVTAVLCGAYVLVPGSLAESVNIYKYKDGDGVWRFTDTFKDSDRVVETKEAITSAPRPKIRLTREPAKTGDVVFAHNDYHGPGEIEVRFEIFMNIRITSNARSARQDDLKVHRFVVTQRGRQPLFTVQPVKTYRSWQYRFSYNYLHGDPRVVYNAQHLYLPPIPPGRRFIISQGFNGPISHKDPHNRYAVDIAMPVNTPIYCARSGIVMEVMNNYFWAGKNLAYYGPRSNLIRVLHDDGSMGLYAHLQGGSAMVRGGQRVREGAMIARSGNTGFSTGPHLHFSVLVNRGMRVVSVPFRFKGDSNQGIKPTKGAYLVNGQ